MPERAPAAGRQTVVPELALVQAVVLAPVPEEQVLAQELVLAEQQWARALLLVLVWRVQAWRVLE